MLRESEMVEYLQRVENENIWAERVMYGMRDLIVQSNEAVCCCAPGSIETGETPGQLRRAKPTEEYTGEVYQLQDYMICELAQLLARCMNSSPVNSIEQLLDLRALMLVTVPKSSIWKSSSGTSVTARQSSCIDWVSLS